MHINIPNTKPQKRKRKRGETKKKQTKEKGKAIYKKGGMRRRKEGRQNHNWHARVGGCAIWKH